MLSTTVKLAGETAVIAINLKNARHNILKIYEEKLKKSFVLKDLKSYRNVVEKLYSRKNQFFIITRRKWQSFSKPLPVWIISQKA